MYKGQVDKAKGGRIKGWRGDGWVGGILEKTEIEISCLSRKEDLKILKKELRIETM